MPPEKNERVTVGGLHKSQPVSWIVLDSEGEMYTVVIEDGGVGEEMDISFNDILADEAGFMEFLKAVKASIKATAPN